MAGQDSEASGPAGSTVVVAPLLALILPGLGHFYLGRRARAVLFCVLVTITLITGYLLQGNLYSPVAGRPLTFLATLGAMGMGTPYFLLRFGLGYAGEVGSAGYEYGTAFLLSAGLMNLLLVLDAWDIASGKKE